MYGQQTDSTKKCFIGSSAFVLVNAVPDQSNPPDFFQLNFGYWLTSKDVLSIEMITWKYNAPLGIPYGASHGLETEKYPGYIKEFGIGLAYQRYLWKGLYSAIHAVPFQRSYRDLKGNQIQKGFQLFTTLRLGYHIPLFKNRFFIEPSIACTHWPIKTNVPTEFQKADNKWPNYFLFEPGLHLGVKF